MLLIRNANIKTMPGPDLKNGCLLLENGKIAAVGQTVDAPEGVETLDAQGRLLTPGCVEAHCHIGLDNEGMRWEGMDYNEIVEPLTPQLRAIDSINPQDEAFGLALRGGVTTACTGTRQRKRRRRHVRHRKAGRKARRPDDSARARRDEVRLWRESQGLLRPRQAPEPYDAHGGRRPCCASCCCARSATATTRRRARIRRST